jgi:hypothetical protein
MVYAWGMRNNQWTPAATAKPGQTLRLGLVPWSKVASKYEAFNRAEPPGDAEVLLGLDAFYGEEKK